MKHEGLELVSKLVYFIKNYDIVKFVKLYVGFCF